MDALFAQVGALLSQKFVWWLAGVYLAAQLWWWLRVHIAKKYRPYTQKYKGSYAIIVAMRRPSPTQLTRCLKSIATHARPNELIITIDDAPHAPKRLMAIAHNYATKVLEQPHRASTREHYAAADTALRKRTDVVIALTPHATWDETTLHVLQPFADGHIGAATPREQKTGTSWAARLHQWTHELHMRVTLPLQGYYAQVHPLSAHFIAMRRDLFAASAQALPNETFLSRRVLTAYHTSLAAYALTHGYGTAYQSSARVQAVSPATWRALLAAQTLQYRSLLRSLYWSRLTQHLRPVILFHLLSKLFSPVLYISLLIVAAFMLGYGVYNFGIHAPPPALATITTFGAIAYLLGLYVRHASQRSYPHYFFTPVLAVAAGLLQLYSKTIALFTFAENNKTARAYGEGKVGRSRVLAAAATFALFAAAVPLAYLMLVAPQGVPFATITQGRGDTYATAQHYATALRDQNPGNDPSPQQLTSFIRANGAHYNQTINDTLAPVAHDCVQQALAQQPANAVLDAAQSCYAQTLAVQQQKQPEPAPPKNPTVTVQAKRGDTLTHLVRAQVKRLDGEQKLTAAQAVFIETTYLRQTGQQQHKLAVNQIVHINTDDLATLIARAHGLTPQQLAAWNGYAQDIHW